MGDAEAGGRRRGNRAKTIAPKLASAPMSVAGIGQRLDRDIDKGGIGQVGEAVGEGLPKRLGHSVERLRHVVTEGGNVKCGEKVQRLDQGRAAATTADGGDPVV